MVLEAAASGRSVTGQQVIPAPTLTYGVHQGDTLGVIAQWYGMKWQELAAANNIQAPYIIHTGQKLTVPPRSSLPRS